MLESVYNPPAQQSGCWKDPGAADKETTGLITPYRFRRVQPYYFFELPSGASGSHSFLLFFDPRVRPRSIVRDIRLVKWRVGLFQEIRQLCRRLDSILNSKSVTVFSFRWGVHSYFKSTVFKVRKCTGDKKFT